MNQQLERILETGYQVHIRQTDDGTMVFHAYPQSSMATKHLWMECKKNQTPEHILTALCLQISNQPQIPKQGEFVLC